MSLAHQPQQREKILKFNPRWAAAAYGATCAVAALLAARLYMPDVSTGFNKLTACVAILGIIAMMMTVTETVQPDRYDD